MITLQHAKELLTKIEYEPNYSFSIEESLFSETYYLRILAKVEDTYSPGKTIEIVGPGSIYPDCTEEGFFQQVLNILRTLVMHEMLEKFKVNGKVFKDPHKENC